VNTYTDRIAQICLPAEGNAPGTYDALEAQYGGSRHI
jgi:hypothetical protein